MQRSLEQTMWKWGGDEKLDCIYITRKWDRYEMGLTPVAGEFPAQRASNADNVSIWWRHHASMSCGNYYVCHAFVPLLYQAWCVHSGPMYFTVLLMAFISRTQFGYTLILQLFRHIHPSSKVTGFFLQCLKVVLQFNVHICNFASLITRYFSTNAVSK